MSAIYRLKWCVGPILPPGCLPVSTWLLASVCIWLIIGHQGELQDWGAGMHRGKRGCCCHGHSQGSAAALSPADGPESCLAGEGSSSCPALHPQLQRCCSHLCGGMQCPYKQCPTACVNLTFGQTGRGDTHPMIAAVCGLTIFSEKCPMKDSSCRMQMQLCCWSTF